MLVLSRKKDQTIVLKVPNQEDIKITVVRIDNRNKVRIGVEADKGIMVLREELDTVQNKKNLSAKSPSEENDKDWDNQISAKS